MRIRVKLFDKECDLGIIEKGDWIDLKTREEVFMLEGDAYIIKLGVAIELPAGYEALLVPRSSTFKKYGIIQTNSMGVIDELYCGDNDEWGLPVYATRYTHIPKGTRIAQFRIIEHMPELEIYYVDELGNKDRKGFGSTDEN